MATGDEEQKVRPIDYAADETPEFVRPHAMEPDPDPRGPPPWIPLAVAVAGVMLVVGAVAGFGALRFDDPTPAAPQEFASGAQSDPEAPPETLPPRLDDALPDLTDRLTLVALVDGDLQTLLWDPSFRVPKPYDLPITGFDESTPIGVSFDSGGRTLAITVTTQLATEVYVGDPTDIGATPDLIDTTSTVWHASKVGALAWVAADGDGRWVLHTGKVDPLSGTVTNDVTVADFPTPVQLMRWDSSGFVVNQGSGVVALDRSGVKTWERAGVAISGSASILAIIAPDDSASNTRWIIADRTTGEASDRAITGVPETTWVTTSRDTDLIAEISASASDRSRILVDGPEIAAKRIVQVDLDVTPIGFTASGEYLQFSLSDSNDLVFVNWRTGATHTVPIPDNTTVLGVDLG